MFRLGIVKSALIGEMTDFKQCNFWIGDIVVNTILRKKKEFSCQGLRKLDTIMKQLFGTSVLLSFRK